MFELRYFFKRTKYVWLGYILTEVLVMIGLYILLVSQSQSYSSFEAMDQASIYFASIQVLIHPFVAVLMISKLELKFVKILGGRTYLYPLILILLLIVSMIVLISYYTNAMETELMFSDSRIKILYNEFNIDYITRARIALVAISVALNICSVMIGYLYQYRNHRALTVLYAFILVTGVILIELFAVQLFDVYADGEVFTSVAHILLYYVSPVIVLTVALRKVKI